METISVEKGISFITYTLNFLSMFEFIETVSGISHYKHTKNGLTVLLLPQESAPVVTVMITYKVGSRNEGIGTTGATHFLEHMMFKGTHKFHKDQGTGIFNVLQSVGARINATTWLDRTNYYEMLPSEHLALALEIEADRMRNVRLDPTDFESERTVILNEFDRGDNEPFRKLYHLVWSTAYQAHPYHHPTIGWRSDIESFSVQALKDFYDTYYYPNNATLSIIGDIRTEEALASINQYFGNIEEAPHDFPEVRVREPEQRGERRVVLREAGELGFVIMAHKIPSGQHEDSFALELLGQILSAGKGSRLFKALTDKGLTNQVSASPTLLKDPSLFVSYAVLNPNITHKKVEQTLFKVFQQIAEKGVTEKEVAHAKRQIFAQSTFERDGTFAVASELNEAIALGDWKRYAAYQEHVNQVTAAQIQAVAAKYLKLEKATIGYFIPA